MIARFMPVKTPSPLARVSLFVYVLLIIYASWFPFSDWQNKNISLFEFLWAHLPKYWSAFDVAINIIGYIPFGALCVLSLYPKVRNGYAVILTLLLGIGLSGSLEAIQNFLPSRVPSNLDFLTNVLGALIGALLGWLATPSFLERGRLKMMRQRWLLYDKSGGLILLGLWFLAQIYPQAYLFGHGQIIPILSSWLSEFWAIPIDLSAHLRHDILLTIEQYWLSEALITSCSLVGAVLTALCLLRRKVPKWPIMLALVFIVLAIKSLASALTFSPEHAFVWLTPGAEAGLLMGSLMLAGFAFVPAVAQRQLAFLMLLLSLIMVNVVPANPYFVATLQTWSQGKFLNFYGAAQGVALAWPFLTLGFLLNVRQRR